MAVERNLYRIKNSCEKLAQMDLDNTNVLSPIISMSDCYTIDGNSYDSDTKFEKKKFGETRIESTNKYAQDYRNQQKSLILRENKVNEKFDELIENLEQVSTQRNTSNNTVLEDSISISNSNSNSNSISNSNSNSNSTQQSITLKVLTSDSVIKPDNSEEFKSKIKDLKIIIKNLNDKIVNLEDKLNEPLSPEEIAEIKKSISVDLGIESVDEIIKLVNENDIDVQNLLLDSLDLEEEEEEENAATATTQAGSTEGFSNKNNNNKEKLVKLKLLENELGKRLQVFENMGTIKIDRYPVIAARVNKTIKNAMQIVGDYNDLMNTIIKNIRERYYNSENTDYKDLVSKLKKISRNSKEGEQLKNETYTSSKNLEIYIHKNRILRSNIKFLMIPLILFFIISMVLTVYYFKM